MLLIDRIKNLKTRPVLGGFLAVCSLAVLALFLTFVLHTNTPLVAESAEIDDSVVDNLATPDAVGNPEQTSANANEQIASVIAQFPDMRVDPNLFGAPVTSLGNPMTGVEELLARCDSCDSSELALPTFSASYSPSSDGAWVNRYSGGYGGGYGGGGYIGGTGGTGGIGGGSGPRNPESAAISDSSSAVGDSGGNGVSADGAATSGQSNSDNTNHTDNNTPPPGTSTTTTTPPTKEKPIVPNTGTGGEGGGGGGPVHEVPEPSFLMLAGLGLSTLAAARRFSRAR